MWALRSFDCTFPTSWRAQRSSVAAAADSFLAKYCDEVSEDGGTHYSPSGLAVAPITRSWSTRATTAGGTVTVEEWSPSANQAVSDDESCVGAHNDVSRTSSSAGTRAPADRHGTGDRSEAHAGRRRDRRGRAEGIDHRLRGARCHCHLHVNQRRLARQSRRAGRRRFRERDRAASGWSRTWRP